MTKEKEMEKETEKGGKGNWWNNNQYHQNTYAPPAQAQYAPPVVQYYVPQPVPMPLPTPAQTPAPPQYNAPVQPPPNTAYAVNWGSHIHSGQPLWNSPPQHQHSYPQAQQNYDPPTYAQATKGGL